MVLNARADRAKHFGSISSGRKRAGKALLVYGLEEPLQMSHHALRGGIRVGVRDESWGNIGLYHESASGLRAIESKSGERGTMLAVDAVRF